MDSSGRRGAQPRKWRQTPSPMDEYLEKNNLWRKLIAKDGSCLFRAVAESLFHCQTRHLHVRETCIGYMRAHKDDFSAFVEEPFEKYLEKMKSPTAWGGQLEIEALSRVYSVDFYVYQEVGKEPIDVTGHEFGKKIVLCFCDGHHYDCVYPRDFRHKAGVAQSILYELLVERVFKQSTSALQGKSGNDLKRDSLSRRLLSGHYVNTEYERWRGAVKVQQQEDRAVAASIQFVHGDMCCVKLDGILKDVQILELSPKEGPVRVSVVGEKREVTVPFHQLVPLHLANFCKPSSGAHYEQSSPQELDLSFQDEFVDARRKKRSGKNKIEDGDGWPSLPGQGTADSAGAPQWVTPKAEASNGADASVALSNSSKAQTSQGSASIKCSASVKNESPDKKEKDSTCNWSGNEVSSSQTVVTSSMSLNEKNQPSSRLSTMKTTGQKTSNSASSQQRGDTKWKAKQGPLPESASLVGNDTSVVSTGSKGKGKSSSGTKKHPAHLAKSTAQEMTTTASAAGSVAKDTPSTAGAARSPAAVFPGGGGGGIKSTSSNTFGAAKTGGSGQQGKKSHHQSGSQTKGGSVPFWKASADPKAKADALPASQQQQQQQQKVVQHSKKDTSGRQEPHSKAESSKAKVDSNSTSKSLQMSEGAKRSDRANKKPQLWRDKKRSKKAAEQVSASAARDQPDLELQDTLKLIRMQEEKSKEFPELSAANYVRQDHSGAHGGHTKSSAGGRSALMENIPVGKPDVNSTTAMSEDIGEDYFTLPASSIPWHARVPSPTFGDNCVADGSSSALANVPANSMQGTSSSCGSAEFVEHVEDEESLSDTDVSDTPSLVDDPLRNSHVATSPGLDERSYEGSPSLSGNHSSDESITTKSFINGRCVNGMVSPGSANTLFRPLSGEAASVNEAMAAYLALQEVTYVPGDRMAHWLCHYSKTYAVGLMWNLIRSIGVTFPVGQFPQKPAADADSLPDLSLTCTMYNFGLEIYLAILQLLAQVKQQREYEALRQSKADHQLQNTNLLADGGATPSKQAQASHLASDSYATQAEPSKSFIAEETDEDGVVAARSQPDNRRIESAKEFVAKAVEEQTRRQRANRYSRSSPSPTAQENLVGAAGPAANVGNGVDSSRLQNQPVSPAHPQRTAEFGQAEVEDDARLGFQSRQIEERSGHHARPWDGHSTSMHAPMYHHHHSSRGGKEQSPLLGEQKLSDVAQLPSSSAFSYTQSAILGAKTEYQELQHGAGANSGAFSTHGSSFSWQYQTNENGTEQEKPYSNKCGNQPQLVGLENPLGHDSGELGADTFSQKKSQQLSSLAGVLQREEVSIGKELVGGKQEPPGEWNYALLKQLNVEPASPVDEPDHGECSFSNSYDLWKMTPADQAKLRSDQTTRGEMRQQQWSPTLSHQHLDKQDQRHQPNGSFHLTQHQPSHHTQEFNQHQSRNMRRALLSPDEFTAEKVSSQLEHRVEQQQLYRQPQLSHTHHLPYHLASHNQQQLHYSQAPQSQHFPQHPLQQPQQLPLQPEAHRGELLQTQLLHPTYPRQLQHKQESHPPELSFQPTQDPLQPQTHQVTGNGFGGIVHTMSYTAQQAFYENSPFYSSAGDVPVDQPSTLPFSETSARKGVSHHEDHITQNQPTTVSTEHQYTTQARSGSGQSSSVFSLASSINSQTFSSKGSAPMKVTGDAAPPWLTDQRLSMSTSVAFRSSLPFPP